MWETDMPVERSAPHSTYTLGPPLYLGQLGPLCRLLSGCLRSGEEMLTLRKGDRSGIYSDPAQTGHIWCYIFYGRGAPRQIKPPSRPVIIVASSRVRQG